MKDCVKNKQQYSFSDDTGDAQVTLCSVADGIDMAFIKAHIGEIDFGVFNKKSDKKYIEIHFCSEGRAEYENGQEYLYFIPGDCCIGTDFKQTYKLEFPMRHYHGIAVCIDIDCEDKCLVDFLVANNLMPTSIAAKLFANSNILVLRDNKQLQRFFASLYCASDIDCTRCMHVKLPELFFLLNNLELSNETLDMQDVQREHVNIARNVAKYIADNISQKITLKMLMTEFGVSDTYLQMIFRTVYGMPVISFIRAQKMQCAAQTLIHSNRNIQDIALEYGYENEGKFSLAFKKMMGDSPSVYRREHSKIKIVQ